ncbi:putative SOS response-associated peptidase YedK [Rhizobium aethiopicum]|uniref:Abasic site processing protein n=1 Tax=Rhizobium aethiopicum TaxID=1138170 RepID=A0A7W6QC96_9HYPH|nr:SOS response-associated peptidase [Rhizobium aethiopicum]MBB4194911.1 putative SOS response-associated peptidase YedK [Rhizobium aethiopicum]MBB4582472.1 putative SOS response-associated peptidase YedK [Rhizobium aethiopicum]
MCSRVYIKESLHDLARSFAFAGQGELDGLIDRIPRYNGSPSQVYPIIIQEAAPGTGIVAPVFVIAKWGLVSASRTPSDRRLPLVDVRCEKIASHKLAGPAYRSRRCLIPVNGFFGWKSSPHSREKQPYAIAMKTDVLFALAGIWEVWRHPAGIDIRTFAVITCAPNEMMKTLSERMPVILRRQEYERWLSPDPNPFDLMKPYSADLMTMWPIGTGVDNLKNTGPEIISPVNLDPQRHRNRRLS